MTKERRRVVEPIAPDLGYLRLSQAGWVWEWMRRTDGYLESFATTQAFKRRVQALNPFVTCVEILTEVPPNRWGLFVMEDPSLFYAQGAVFWQPDFNPGVLAVTAVPAEAGDSGAVDLGKLAVRTTVLKAPFKYEQALFSDGLRSIQLHITQGTLLEGPVRLAHDLHGLDAVRDERITTAYRLAGLIESQRFPTALFAPLPQAPRWLRWLTALDLQRAGYSQTEIARRIYKAELVSKALEDGVSRWPLSRVERLLDNARDMLEGGYLQVFQKSEKR